MGKRVSIQELSDSFPDLTVADISDLFFMFGLKLNIEMRYNHPPGLVFDAWKEKARHEREGY